SRHDKMAVGIHEIQPQLVRPLVLMPERHAQRDGALRMRGRNLLRDNGVKRAKEIEFPIFFSGGIAQDSNLNIHPAKIRHEFHELARISLSVTFAKQILETNHDGELESSPNPQAGKPAPHT